MTEAQQRTIAYSFHDVDGERLHVADTGRTYDDASTPLLIFNGVGASTRLLEPLLTALHHHRVILFDIPGVGASRAASRIRRLPALAALTTELLDRLGVDRVNLLGVSWGGGLAQEYARRYPERCERLVLAATSTGHLMVPPNPLVMWRMATPLRYLSAGYAKAIAGAIYGGDLRRDSARTEEHVRRMEPPSWWGYASQLYALVGWTSLPWLHQLRLPTLVMAGRDDPLVPLVNARLLARLIPSAELEIYDCGHLFLLTRKAEAVARIDRFLMAHTALAPAESPSESPRPPS